MNTRKLLSLFALLALALPMAGCGEDPLSTELTSLDGENTVAQANLDEEFGGIAFTDESEGFGDLDLLAEAASDEAVAADDDEAELISRDPATRDLAERDDLVRTHLRILWGRLDGRPEGMERDEDDTTPPDFAPLDWSGGLSVSDGAVFVRKVIRFERPRDHLLPRDDRTTVAWNSHTRGHFDGLLITVVGVPGEDGALPGTLTFRTPQLSETFDIADLADLDMAVPVNDMGDGVSFMSLKPEPAGCAQGMLEGFWKSNREGPGGMFRGHWVSETGRHRGFILGRYGLNSEGEPRWAAKIIHPSGRILGLAGGTYEGNDDGSGNFIGRWVNRAGTTMGTLGGRYMEAPDHPGAGFFQGKWEENCPTVDTAG